MTSGTRCDARDISRRAFLATSAATAALPAASSLAAGAERTTRPNLVFLFADQLRVQACGYAGDRRARTPSIDRLAAQAANFCNAVSNTPVCAAYRAALFTGKHTTSTGMAINELRLSPEHECFGHVLTRSGYETGYIGKWHLWANQLGHHDDPRNGFIPPGPYRLGFDGYWAAYNFHHNYYDTYYYKDTPEKLRYGGPGTYEPDAQTDMAIDFMRRADRGGKPFALFLSYGTPHDPWGWNNAPKQYADMFRGVEFPLPPNYWPDNDPHADNWAKMSDRDRRSLGQWQQGYYAMTANLDWNVGRLLAELDKSDAAADTIVVFTSDHGEMFGAHGRRAKNIFYEEAVRVPFLVRWPGRIQPHAPDACLGTPDIMPTLLSLMNLPVPKDAEGMSLSHCALGKPGPEPEAVLLQCLGATAAWADGHEWRALRDKRHTYARFRSDGAELLFDNRDDPYQQKNLVRDPAHSQALERFREMLRRRMADLGDTFEKCSWYRDHWTQDRNIMRGARGGSHDLDALGRIVRKHFPIPKKPKPTDRR